jgi:prepilin-type N-terminal cleavage/methylation domain-containing protein
MHINRAICDSGRAPVAVAAGWPRHAFTLVELMVVIVIIGILASLTLAGLAGVRGRAKIDKTRNTIRKLDDLVMAKYESYQRRRVRATTPFDRLTQLRRLMVYEMPDNWNDVLEDPTDTVFNTTAPSPPRLARGFAAYKQALRAAEKKETKAGNLPFDQSNASAECLYMLVARGGLEPEALEFFRNDEIGDTDGDGAPEFLDAWGRPISFIRWAPGFSPYSSIQVDDSSTHHDPLDPFKEDLAGYALYPLIMSRGPDEELGIFDPLAGAGWIQFLPPNGPGLATIVGLKEAETLGSVMKDENGQDRPAYRDNITSHGLAKE